jgi:hypothetical protein
LNHSLGISPRNGPELLFQLVARSIEWGNDANIASGEKKLGLPDRSFKSRASSPTLFDQLYHSPASAGGVPASRFESDFLDRKSYNQAVNAQVLA